MNEILAEIWSWFWRFYVCVGIIACIAAVYYLVTNARRAATIMEQYGKVTFAGGTIYTSRYRYQMFGYMFFYEGLCLLLLSATLWPLLLWFYVYFPENFRMIETIEE